MIYCCCNEAQTLCVDTCSRWRHRTEKPDFIGHIKTWSKNPRPKRSAAVQAACDYADRLNWPEVQPPSVENPEDEWDEY
jgi:hypothetical protein